MFKKITIIFITLMFFGMGLSADTKPVSHKNIKTPFNFKKVIEQVMHHPVRDGEKILIRGRVYEAIFKEGKVILRAKDKHPGAEDVIIPVEGNPEIRGNKVVYEYGYGQEVAFEGKREGIRFTEINPGHQPSQMGGYRGNIAGLKEGYNRDGIKSGEFLIDTNVVYVGAPNSQWYPSIAFDGTNYLVVWQDNRNGSDYDIYATRISIIGEILDTAGIPICTAANGQYSPSVAFDGTNYLVVWVDDRNGSDDIYGSRINPSGIILDTAGIAICTAANWQSSPSVAFDGVNYFVAWEDERTGSVSIYGSRIDTSGAVLDTAGIPICTAANWRFSPSIAFDGVNYLVVWEDYRNSSDYGDIYGARVTTSGVVLDTAGIPISTGGSKPSVAFNGTNYLVVWSNGDIYGARVTTSGVVLDTAGISISPGGDEPSVAFDGTNYLVVWDDNRNGYSDIYGARVDTSGTVLDTGGIPISTAVNSQQCSSIAFDGTNYLVVWEDYRNGSADIYGARINTSGTVLDTGGISISTAVYGQYSPSIAFDGVNYLVAWDDNRNGYSDIYGARVSTSGVVLDPVGIPISITAYHQIRPSITFDGINYFVVWEDGRSGFSDVYGSRVTPSGEVLDTLGISISTAAYWQKYPCIAFSGVNYLVVWEDGRSGSWNEDIYGARISTSGVVLDTGGIPISTAGSWQEYPSIAFDGTNYLVVWTDGRNGSWDIYGARVDTLGTVLDTVGIPISTASNNQKYPSVAFDGTRYFVVWQDAQNGFWDIYGARVSTSGTVLDTAGIPISTASEDQKYPSIAFDGTNYLVVWEDERSGSDYDIYGAKVDTSGTVIDSFPVSIHSGDQISPALAKGSGNQMLVVYSGWIDSINGKPANTMRIWGKFSPFTGIKEKPNAKFKVQNAKLLIYPNPFTQTMEIKYRLTAYSPQLTAIKVYDVSGRLVKTLLNKQQKSGYYTIKWDGTDNIGKKLSSGIYFIHLDAGKWTATRKIILMR